MPIYEYRCADCETKFDALRGMNQADDPIACPHCGGMNTSRSISTFAAVSKGSSEGSQPINGSSSCTPTTCSFCSLCRPK